MKGESGELVLGRYRIDHPLGHGGFGRIHVGRQVSLNREVAIKSVRPELGDAAAVRERFRREAVLAAGINHPNVVTYHDFGVDADGDLILVMERLKGWTLLEELRKRPLPSAPLAAMRIRQAAAGLGAAHRAGIVHRDVKPSNLFLVAPGTPDERLKVIDFGILRVAAGARQEAGDPGGFGDLEDLTRSDAFIGTPDYAAPEMILGQDIDGRADQYALALVALLMLTGRKGFVTRDPGALLARVSRRPAAVEGPAGEADRLGAGVREVLYRALTPDPEGRYPDVVAFADALAFAAEADDPGETWASLPTAVLEGGATPGGTRGTPTPWPTPVGLGGRPEVTAREVPRARRGRRVAIAAAAAMLLLAAAGGGLLAGRLAPWDRAASEVEPAAGVAAAQGAGTAGTAEAAGAAEQAAGEQAARGGASEQAAVEQVAGAAGGQQVAYEAPPATAVAADDPATGTAQAHESAASADGVADPVPGPGEARAGVGSQAGAGHVVGDAPASGPESARGDVPRGVASPAVATRPRANRPSDVPDPGASRPRSQATGDTTVATGTRSESTPQALVAGATNADAAPRNEPPADAVPRETAPERPAFATLTLNAEPWAEVRVDGRPVGTTPVVGVSVPAGRHRIEFVHPTLGVRVVEPTLAGGEKRTLRMRFTTGDEEGTAP